MKSVIVVSFLIFKSCSGIESNATYTSCGLDGSPATMVYAGVAAIETYPWMGMLYYPMKKRRFMTSVVLITRQMVIAAANEIDLLPKTDFRAKARVVLGHRCGVGSEIKVRDYTYHPEYVRNSFSALAMIQLETDHVITELRPVCQPPAHFVAPEFFAMTLTESCKNPKVRIHRMKYVDIKECRNFYRRSGLGQDSLWPVHTACARAVSGGRCVWRSGSVLAVKQDGRWRLVGFSVYGPGCGDPARFLDYGKYHQWVRLSSSTVGQPAITRMGDNVIVLRRSLANLQRFGPCDPEEKTTELYTDKVSVVQNFGTSTRAKYNVSLYASVEYSCITLRARPFTTEDFKRLHQVDQPFEPSQFDREYSSGDVKKSVPKLYLRRWCASASGICHGFQHIEIQFYFEVYFRQSVEFTVHAYGKPAKVISATSSLKYANKHKGISPNILPYHEVMHILKRQMYTNPIKWFYY